MKEYTAWACLNSQIYTGSAVAKGGTGLQVPGGTLRGTTLR